MLSYPTRLPSDQAALVSTQTAEQRQPPASIERHYGRRQSVFRMGEAADRIYEVLDGVLMVFTLLADGRRQIVEIVPRGFICGFAKTSIHANSCEALTDATVLAYPRREMEPDDPVRRRLLFQVEGQVCGLHDHTLTLGRKSAEERLATFLMRFIPGRGRQECPGPRRPRDEARLHIPLSRGEIADHLGLTLETVSRELTALTRKGLITVGPRRGEIHVGDICRLCTAAHGECRA